MSDLHHPDEPPYSKTMLTRALTAVGLPTTRAYELALRVEHDLAAYGDAALELDHLEQLATSVVGEEEAAAAVRKLRLYREFRRLELPIVVLIGGGTGSGKSSVATEVAHRLGITRVQSTDVIRHTMRAFFSEQFMPSIHYSSFEAGRAHHEDEPNPVLSGFLEQTRNVLVGMGAVIERALSERWSIVLEGVHLVPGMLPPIEGALTVHCVLHIEEPDAHAAHFWIRDTTSGGMRPVQRYLDALPDIRLIQSTIVDRARRHGVPVIENRNIEWTITEVMDLVLSSVETRRPVAPGAG
jgi:2-phosphoglycerate kinase